MSAPVEDRFQLTSNQLSSGLKFTFLITAFDKVKTQCSCIWLLNQCLRGSIPATTKNKMAYAYFVPENWFLHYRGCNRVFDTANNWGLRVAYGFNYRMSEQQRFNSFASSVNGVICCRHRWIINNIHSRGERRILAARDEYNTSTEMLPPFTCLLNAPDDSRNHRNDRFCRSHVQRTRWQKIST